jgi:hypothetical protein
VELKYMSVKKEETKNIKLSAKGILVELNTEGFIIEDEKDGTKEVLSLEEIKELLVGKSVNITFANKELFVDE